VRPGPVPAAGIAASATAARAGSPAPSPSPPALPPAVTAAPLTTATGAAGSTAMARSVSPSVAIDTVFTPAAADEAAAWRALAGLWGASLAAGEPCGAAATQSLLCFRSRGGLAEVRRLDRPGIVRLVDARGRVAHALLTGFNGEQATLGLGGSPVAVPLADLARVWRGEYATFWRAPPGYREADIGSTAAGSAWLAQRLSAADGQAASAAGRAALRSRIATFQLAQGLTPDGVAGPLTLMQLGRASGSDEPRLARR